MEEKVMIIARSRGNVFDAIVEYLNSEAIDYVVCNDFKSADKGCLRAVCIGECSEEFIKFLSRKKCSLVWISDTKSVLDDYPCVNYIITNFINDKTSYTSVQKQYLYKNGGYRALVDKFAELLENANGYNGMIYDLTELKWAPDNWIFNFDSINDTYAWLLRKNNTLPSDFVRKIVNFCDDKVYDDSLREINYLTDKLKEIKEGKRILDIFICTKDELEFFKKNYFFKLLVKNISSTYRLFLVNKDKLLKNDEVVMTKLMDGLAIYDNCIYRDTYDDEFSLGYVDCNESSIKEYNEHFDYVLDKYGVEIKTEEDLDEF